MTRYLVTGGAGFIGCNYVRFLLAGYPDVKVTVYDKLTYSGRVENLEEPLARFKDRCELVVGDICDSTAVGRALQAAQPDIVVNFAAETHVDRSIADPDTFVHTDVNGTAVLLRQAGEQGVARYHQVSTDEVYGPVPVSQRSSEGDVLNPSSPYSASKAAGDLMALAWHQTYGLPVTVSRGANCVGAYQYPEKVVPLFATNALLNLPLPVYGDGKQRRDYQHVLDHCAGIQAVLDHGQPGEIYNIGTGTEITNLEMVRILLETLDKPRSLIRHVQDRPGHDRRYGLDISKMLDLGWSPAMSVEESVTAAVCWYRDNRAWWEPVRAGEFQDYYARQYAGRPEHVR